MHVRTGSAAARSLSTGDALEELCFSDAVFSQRYEGWRVLGRGPWATVVKTRSRDLNQDIALKVFVNVDSELLDRVRQEVRAVMALATPYLVHTYSLFDRGPIAWFEMEFVEGPNLQQELDTLDGAGERLPLARAYDIALALSRCVWHAHRHGVLHRDIKPSNVLLPASGRPPAKLSDFGVARLAELAESTPPGAVTGTPRFASPEALAGEPVGPHHDVYGLAATLYALFAGGQLAYALVPGGSVASLRRRQLAGQPKPLRVLTPAMDAGVERVLMQALAADPRMRPPVRRAVLALERAQARLAAARPSPATRINSSLRPWRVAAASLGLLILGLWRKVGRRESRRAAPN